MNEDQDWGDQVAVNGYTSVGLHFVHQPHFSYSPEKISSRLKHCLLSCQQLVIACSAFFQ
ncbi:MAG: hypothetical protein AAFV72_11925 [Cyanobacteria bacterium J06635_1]